MEETKRCPYCGEEIMATAKKCRHCGEWLDNESKEENVSTDRNVPIDENEDALVEDDTEDDEEREDGAPKSFFQAYVWHPFCTNLGLLDFTSKATRKEFWFTSLFAYLIWYLLSTLCDYSDPFSSELTMPPVMYIIIPVGIALTLGGLAITSRRLYDIGKSWTWLFILLIPVVGQIWMICLCCLPGTKKNGVVKFKAFDVIVLIAYFILIYWLITNTPAEPTIF